MAYARGQGLQGSISIINLQTRWIISIAVPWKAHCAFPPDVDLINDYPRVCIMVFR